MLMADPDGQELILEDLAVRAAVHGMLSLTELEFRFRNPQSRRIEGRFSCVLPPGASISRFAKDVNGQLMEGEVVERLRANQVYEQFLHQMRDPALLEQDNGNRFSARIFPIEGGATVRIILSYSSLLPLRDGVRSYSLPLRGMQKIGHFSFRGSIAPLPGETMAGSEPVVTDQRSGLTRSTVEVLTRNETNFTATSDIVLSWRPAADAARSRVLRAGDFYVASFRPQLARIESQVVPKTWMLYVDTSASSADSASNRIRALESFVAALPPSTRITVRAFDQEIVPLLEGNASEVASRLGAALRARLFLGGTDLAAVLREIAAQTAKTPDIGVIVASDVAATVGDTERSTITQLATRLGTRTTLHVLTVGSRTDDAIAKTLTAGRGRLLSIPLSTALETDAALAAADAMRPRGQAFDVSDANAEWFYPRHVDDIREGDEVLVLGRVKAGQQPGAAIAGTSAASVEALPAASFAPLLQREAFRQYLDYLAEREANEESEAVRKALAGEQVRISVEERVVIPRTTMLVLESEADYQRFGIDRRALAAILTVDAGGIGRVDRKGIDFMPIVSEVTTTRPAQQRKTAAARDDRGLRPPASAPEADGSAGAAPTGVHEQIRSGVAESAPAGMTDQAVNESVSVTAAAPAVSEPFTTRREAGVIAPPLPPPSPRPVPTERPRQITEAPKVSAPDWIRHERPTKGQLEEAVARLKSNAQDREAYNQLGEIYAALGMWSELRAMTLQWQPLDPDNPHIYELLGLAAESLGSKYEAARAYGSLVEVAPGKTELLQRAGLLLLRVGKASIAEAPLRRALELRPDRVNGYRHLALMLMMSGRLDEAARVLETATRQTFPAWYGDAQRVVREELGYVYRAIVAKDSTRRAEIAEKAQSLNVDLQRTDALRVTLAWETDANDVDLHVVDPRGEECFYSHKQTRSGLSLYEDITQGLGPEVIRTDSLQSGTYHIGVRYFAAGPMGVSRGVAIVMRGGAIDILPFRLVQGGGDIRYLMPVNVKQM
jgi:tetratricopeptide (TPR) repeat protein